MAIAAFDPAAAELMSWAGGIRDVPRSPQAVDAGEPGRVGGHPAVVEASASDRSQERVVRNERRPDEHDCSRNDGPVRQLDGYDATVLHNDSGNRYVDDSDGPRVESKAFVFTQFDAVGEEDDVVRPLANQRRLVDRERSVGSADHGYRLIPNFVAVAVRTMQYSRAPLVVNAGDIGQFVSKPGGHQDRPRVPGLAALEADLESLVESNYFAAQNFSTVSEDFLASSPMQLLGCGTIAREEVVNMVGRRVAWFFGIDNDHLSAGASQKCRGTESGWAATDYHGVVRQDASSVVRYVVNVAELSTS